MTERTAAVSKSVAAPDALIGRLVNDRFKITALIARGGMGKIYRAEQAPLGRLCALKVLNPNYTGEHDPEFHKRFFLEASIASKLTHPNTVTIFDYGRTDDDIYYMAMEYLEGRTLHRAIREAGPLPEERASHIARQIARALREAHSLGVIHRDLKPANIFLVEHGDEPDFVKVLDFGLVKNVGDNKGEDLTQAGVFMGSPKYMAPEQIRGDRCDARTDIYALGVILYEMVTGKVPFDRSSSVNILMAHVNEDVPPMRVMNPNIQITPGLEEAVLRCLSKDADNRYRSMDEVLTVLKHIGAGALTATVSGVVSSGEYQGGVTSSGAHSTPSMTPNGTSSGEQAAVRPSSGPSEPGVLAAATLHALPPKKGSAGMLIGSVVVGLALVAGIGVFAATRTSPDPKPAATAAAAQVATATSTETAPPAPPAVAPTTVTPATAPATTTAPAADTTAAAASEGMKTVLLNSEPEGASVKEDGVEICSFTPCKVPYSGAEAEATFAHKLTFTKPGYKAEQKTIKVGETPVVAKLTRLPTGPAPAPVKTGAPIVPGYRSEGY